jgi:ribosomal protein S18 acetylase RimI-like enzyme
MKTGQIIQKASLNGWEMVFRFPKKSDVEGLRDFINELSKERTFLRFQGEQVSLEEEEQYLTDLLDKLKQNKAIIVLAIHEGKIVGSADIKLGQKTDRHVGMFGIALSKEYRDQGLGTYLMKLILEQAQTNMPELEIVKLGVQAPNKRAFHLYQKLGFKQYGLLPDGVKLEQGYRDRIFMYRRVK